MQKLETVLHRSGIYYQEIALWKNITKPLHGQNWGTACSRAERTEHHPQYP